MSGANVGGGDVIVSEVDTGRHMADFDALPESVRRLAAGMSINWCGSDILAVFKSHGERACIAALRKTEADMQSGYRQRIAA